MIGLRESLLDGFKDQADDLKKKHISDWLEKNNMYRAEYTIQDDYTINISRFNYKGEGDFPEYIQFNRCSHGFACYGCGMTSLRGCPQYVAGFFDCSNNDLKTLKYCPVFVGQSFNCSFNGLKELDFLPEKIGSSLMCMGNHLKTLKNCPKKIDGIFNCSKNKLKTLKGGPEYVTRDYVCDDNPLITLDGAPRTVKGIMRIENTHLSQEQIDNFKKKNPDFNIYP